MSSKTRACVLRKEKKFWWEEILRKRDEVWTRASPVWGCSLRPARGTTSAAVILISVGTLESWSFECDLRYTLEEKNCLDIFFSIHLPRNTMNFFLLLIIVFFSPVALFLGGCFCCSYAPLRKYMLTPRSMARLLFHASRPV